MFQTFKLGMTWCLLDKLDKVLVWQISVSICRHRNVYILYILHIDGVQKEYKGIQQGPISAAIAKYLPVVLCNVYYPYIIVPLAVSSIHVYVNKTIFPRFHLLCWIHISHSAWVHMPEQRTNFTVYLQQQNAAECNLNDATHFDACVNQRFYLPRILPQIASCRASNHSRRRRRRWGRGGKLTSPGWGHIGLAGL